MASTSSVANGHVTSSSHSSGFPVHVKRQRKGIMVVSNPDPDTDEDEPTTHNEPTNDTSGSANMTVYYPYYNPGPSYKPEPPHSSPAATNSYATHESFITSGSSTVSSPTADATPPPQTPSQQLIPHPVNTDVVTDGSDTAQSPVARVVRPSRSRDMLKRDNVHPSPWNNGIGYSPQYTAATDQQGGLVSPTGSNIYSNPSPVESRGIRPVCILASFDTENFQSIDITNSTTGAMIRELMFSRLKIPDDEQSRYAIYRTELGQDAIGVPLTDNDLYRMCSTRNLERDLKFLVRQDYSRGHLLPVANYELPPMPTFAPPPAPRLLQASTHNARPEASPRSPRSDHRSGSSVSDRPAELRSVGGYEASSEGDRERERLRSPFSQYIPSGLPNGPHAQRGQSSSHSTRQDPPSPVKARPRNASVSDIHKDISKRSTSPITLMSQPESHRSTLHGQYMSSSTMMAASPPGRGHVSGDEAATSMWTRQVSRRPGEGNGEQKEDRSREQLKPVRRGHAEPIDMDAVEQARKDLAVKSKQQENLLSPNRQHRPNRPSTAHAPYSPSVHDPEHPVWTRPQTSHTATPTQVHPASLIPSMTPTNQSSYLPPGAAAPAMRTVPTGWFNRAVLEPRVAQTPAPPLIPSRGLNKMKSENGLSSRFGTQTSNAPLPSTPGHPNIQSNLGRASPYLRTPSEAIPAFRSPPHISTSGSNHSTRPLVVAQGSTLSPQSEHITARPSKKPGLPTHGKSGSASKAYSNDLSTSRFTPPLPSPTPRKHKSRRDVDSESRVSPSSTLGSPSVVSPRDHPSYGSRMGSLQGPRERRGDDSRPVETRLPIGPSNSNQAPRDVNSAGDHEAQPFSSEYLPAPRHPRVNPIKSSLNAKHHSSIPTRPPRSPSESETESTLKGIEYSNYFKDIDFEDSATIVLPPPPRIPPPPPPIENSDIAFDKSRQPKPSESLGSNTENVPELSPVNPSSDSESSDTESTSSSDSERVWVKRPSDNNLSSSRSDSSLRGQQPQLTLQIDPKAAPTLISGSPDHVHGDHRPPETPGSSGGQTLKPLNRPRGAGSFSEQQNGPWDQMRPRLEEVYDRLEHFFPGLDLDKTFIEVPSGGTSPTVPDQPPHPFNQVDKVVARTKQKKKSIRVVAHEKRNNLVRQSMMETSHSAKVRRRNTKFWDSQVEEMQAGRAASSTPDSSSAPPRPPNPTRQVFKWLRGDLIGRGNYGKVYLAMNVTTGEMIAVKQVEIPTSNSDRANSRQQLMVDALKSESATLKDLDHANIVQYLGIEETPEYLSIFMEYVSGGSIGACLQKHGRFGDHVVQSFTGQILAGLEYLHLRGILHRDLKADNILVDPQGNCKISDFGISKRSSDSDAYEPDDAATQMQGTVYYMAPEVVHYTSGEGYSAKVDIWSLGCVWHEMCAGERPWKSETMYQVIYQLGKLKQAPPLPEGTEISELAQDFRMKCFVTDPRERPNATVLRTHKYLVLPPGWEFTRLMD